MWRRRSEARTIGHRALTNKSASARANRHSNLVRHKVQSRHNSEQRPAEPKHNSSSRLFLPDHFAASIVRCALNSQLSIGAVHLKATTAWSCAPILRCIRREFPKEMPKERERKNRAPSDLAIGGEKANNATDSAPTREGANKPPADGDQQTAKRKTTIIDFSLFRNCRLQTASAESVCGAESLAGNEIA